METEQDKKEQAAINTNVLRAQPFNITILTVLYVGSPFSHPLVNAGLAEKIAFAVRWLFPMALTLIWAVMKVSRTRFHSR